MTAVQQEIQVRGNNIQGQTFGDIYVKGLSDDRGPKGELLWLCVCPCSEVFPAASTNLKRGRHQKCPKCLDEDSKESPYRTLYGNYKRNATLRQHSFDIEFDTFVSLTKMKCTYCGIPPFQVLKKNEAKYGIVYMGVDRVDNHLGYIDGNVVPCCKYCNLAKSRFKLEEFVGWLSKVKEQASATRAGIPVQVFRE